MKEKTSGNLLILLFMLVAGVAIFFIGFFAWWLAPNLLPNHLHIVFLQGGLLLSALVLSIAFLELTPWQKTWPILSIGGSLLIIGLVIVIAAARLLAQSPTTSENFLYILIGWTMTYVGCFAFAASILEYYARKTINKTGIVRKPKA